MAPTSKAFVTVLFLSLALCQITAAASLKDEPLDQIIVLKLRESTTLSTKLEVVAKGITDETAADIGKEIPAGFDKISEVVEEATKIISNAHKPPRKFTDPRAKIVVKELTKFVEAQQKLQEVLIKKHGIENFAEFFPDITTSLRALEGEEGYFKNNLKEYFPKTQESAAKEQFDSLKKTIEKTIKVFKEEAIEMALTTFLQAQRALLNVLIGKHGITTYAGDLA